MYKSQLRHEQIIFNMYIIKPVTAVYRQFYFNKIICTIQQYDVTKIKYNIILANTNSPSNFFLMLPKDNT